MIFTQLYLSYFTHRAESHGEVCAGSPPIRLHHPNYIPSFRMVLLHGLRPCINNWGLNSITIKFLYLLPLIPAALEEVRPARIFTKLELHSSYNLVRVRAGDKGKTAFSTTFGHYQYQVMPYGLACVQSIFQCLINCWCIQRLAKEILNREI